MQPGDKLIALSGIARSIADQMQDEYVAGMWIDTLAWELCWSIDESEVARSKQHSRVMQPRRPTQYRAPAFSWASVDGVVNACGKDEGDTMIQVLHVNLEYRTGDKTGLLTGGHLTLRCQLQKLSLRWHQIASWKLLMSINDVDARQTEVLSTNVLVQR